MGLRHMNFLDFIICTTGLVSAYMWFKSARVKVKGLVTHGAEVKPYTCKELFNLIFRNRPRKSDLLVDSIATANIYSSIAAFSACITAITGVFSFVINRL